MTARIFPLKYGIGGAVFNQITKGGTNNFHGSAYEYFQNDALNARSYFDPPDQAVLFHKYNQFGGAIGGPVLRNKLFVYFNYDKTINNGTYSGFVSMPSDQLKGVGTPGGGYDFDTTVCPRPGRQ